MRTRGLLLLVLALGLSVEGSVGSDGDAWYEALVGFTWRFGR